MLDSVGELLINVLCEGWAGIISEYPYEHNSIVLDVRTVVIILGQKLADLGGGSLGCLWACDGGLDDGGQVEDLFTLGLVSCGQDGYSDKTRTEFAAPDSQNNL